MDAQGLVPFLPDDVALQCLLRVPVQSHLQMQNVSRKWRELVNSTEFYEHRKKEGTTGHCVCFLQSIPPAANSGANSPHPLFNVSVLNEKHVWERLPPIPDFHPDELSATGLPLFCRLAAVGGHLVILGGWRPSSMEELRSVYIFSFSSWTWRRGADMPRTRSFFACSVLHNRILVAGGHDRNKNALRTADRYHLDRDRWESLPDMNTPRDECASVVLDEKFFVISGYTTSSQGEFRRDAEVLDPESNAWTELDHMWSKAVSPSSVVATGGKLFAFHHSQLVSYDAKERFWHVVDTVPEDERGVSSVVSATAFGNSIVVTGPSNTEDGSHRVLVYRLPASMDRGHCKAGRWETVPVGERFRGIAHASCVVEV